MTAAPEAASALTAEALLARLSDHLDGLASEVHRVEQVVGTQASAARPAPSGAIVQLQSLDHLRQSLEDLSMLTLFLARSDETGIPGLQNPGRIRCRMRLGSTRALFDKFDQSSISAAPPNTGEIDLF